MTDSESPKRKQRQRERQRARRREARKTQAQATSAQGSGESREPTLENPSDIGLWQEVRRHPDFRLSQKVFEEVGDDLLVIAKNETHKVGERIRAYSELRMLHNSNRSGQSLQFNVHRHYTTRHSHAEDPKPEDGEQVVDAVAYRMAVSDQEAKSVADELEKLGLIGHLLGMGGDEQAE